MKYFFLFLFAFWTIVAFAQEEVEPTFGVETERVVEYAEINGQIYNDITVEINSARMGGDRTFWRDGGLADPLRGVKVIVRDKKGKKIYKKRFSKSFLYAFSNGTLQVGTGNAVINMVLFKSELSGKWIMEIKDKGIY